MRVHVLPWILVFPLLISACSSGNGDSPSAGADAPGPIPEAPGGEARAGTSMNVVLTSNVDGEDISITVHEPTQFVEGQKYPLILEGHGYGGSKVDAASRPAAGSTGTFGRLLDAGYGIISIDQRGFGASGGTVRLFDPDFEGKDLIQILDWAEETLPWLAYRDGNLLLGAIGGSYGGGYQHTIYALDPKKRLDAIAPEITWHDLRYSLNSGNVFKSYWATLLSAAGNATGTQDMQVNQGLAEGLLLNQLSEENLDLLYRVSLISHCENNNPAAPGPLTKIDALYWQSARDTLFNLNDAVDNFECLNALGGDVRLLVKANGHDGGGNEACGVLDKTQSIVDWYDEKLKGVSGKASYIPKYCFQLDTEGTDGVVTGVLPKGGQSFQVPATMVFPLLANVLQPPTSVPLFTAGNGGAVLAGIPTIQLDVADLNPADLEAGDPIVFIGIGVRRAGSSTDTLVMGNQVRPFRGYGRFEEELVGVTTRLNANDEVRLLIYPSFAMRYPATGARLLSPVSVSATLQLPLLPGSLAAAPVNVAAP